MGATILKSILWAKRVSTSMDCPDEEESTATKAFGERAHKVHGYGMGRASID